MDIKAKLVEILEKENYTFAQLAEYLHMTEEGLTHELENKTLEVRNLEAISKALRVPLYSFFRLDNSRFDYHEKPYYMNRLWTESDHSRSVADLTKDIKILKQILASKEEQLKKLGA